MRLAIAHVVLSTVPWALGPCRVAQAIGREDELVMSRRLVMLNLNEVSMGLLALLNDLQPLLAAVATFAMLALCARSYLGDRFSTPWMTSVLTAIVIGSSAGTVAGFFVNDEDMSLEALAAELQRKGW